MVILGTFRRSVATMVLVAAISACDLVARDWPAREGKTPEQILLDLVVRQGQAYVRKSVGELRGECFTEEDLGVFMSTRTPSRIVERLRRSPDFKEVTGVLRALPPARRAEAFRMARAAARPTWRQMGYIDRQGRGQTDAGHDAELQISAAIVDAFAAAVGGP